MRVNFTDVEDRQNFDAFSGKHHVKVTKVTNTETKNEGKLPAGTPGWNVEFTVQEGQHATRKVWNNYWFAKSTLGFLKQMLVATGQWNMDELSHEIDVDEDDLIGLDLVVRTKVEKGHDGYDDRTTVSGYYQYDETTFSPEGSTEASLLP